MKELEKIIARTSCKGSNMVYHALMFYHVPKEMLETEAEGRVFQQLPKELTNIKVLHGKIYFMIAVIA